MYLSCCVWALTASDESVVTDMRTLGFRWIDIRPDFLKAPTIQALAEANSLKVSSVTASYGVPDNAALDSLDQGVRANGLAHVEQVVSSCAAMGGSVVYLVPGTNDSQDALSCYCRFPPRPLLIARRHIMSDSVSSTFLVPHCPLPPPRLITSTQSIIPTWGFSRHRPCTD